MSPLVFLVIPIVVFALGSAVLWAATRWRAADDFTLQRLPDDLRLVAPTVRDQRMAGWQSGVPDREVRS